MLSSTLGSLEASTIGELVDDDFASSGSVLALAVSSSLLDGEPLLCVAVEDATTARFPRDSPNNPRWLVGDAAIAWLNASS